MKAMKKAAGATGLTASAAFTKVAETTELKPKAVKAVVTNYLQLATTELKKNGRTFWMFLAHCTSEPVQQRLSAVSLKLCADSHG